MSTPMESWLRLVRAEYLEMPGLNLTKPQAQRLWGLDGGTSAAIVRLLVTRGVLWETPTHSYALAAGTR